jgi:hypothetical protein
MLEKCYKICSELKVEQWINRGSSRVRDAVYLSVYEFCTRLLWHPLTSSDNETCVWTVGGKYVWNCAPAAPTSSSLNGLIPTRKVAQNNPSVIAIIPSFSGPAHTELDPLLKLRLWPLVSRKFSWAKACTGQETWMRLSLCNLRGK